MTLDYKGFTEEEIQKLIDWKAEMKKFDEIMWKLHAQHLIKEIMYNILKESKEDLK